MVPDVDAALEEVRRCHLKVQMKPCRYSLESDARCGLFSTRTPAGPALDSALYHVGPLSR